MARCLSLDSSAASTAAAAAILAASSSSSDFSKYSKLRAFFAPGKVEKSFYIPLSILLPYFVSSPPQRVMHIAFFNCTKIFLRKQLFHTHNSSPFERRRVSILPHTNMLFAIALSFHLSGPRFLETPLHSTHQRHDRGMPTKSNTHTQYFATIYHVLIVFEKTE